MSSFYKQQSKRGKYHYLPTTEENSPLAAYTIGAPIHKVVRVERCRYQTPEGVGFAVYEVEVDNWFLTIIGEFPYKLELNSYYDIVGTVVLGKTGCRQIKVSTCVSALPTDQVGIITVLKTLHGLDTRAYKLYEAFGSQALEVIKKTPEKVVTRVKGIGIERAKVWQKELLSRSNADEEMTKLYNLGLTPAQTIRLVSENGLDFCEQVRQNPYLLVGKVHGYSFTKCDDYALKAGGDSHNPKRLEAGLLSVLAAVQKQGHCTCCRSVFMESAHFALDVALDWRTATQIVKAPASGNVVRYRKGKETYDVPLNDLQRKLETWNAKSHRKGERFHYVLRAISDTALKGALRNLEQTGQLRLEIFQGEEYITPETFYKAEQIIVSGICNLLANKRRPFETTEETIAKVLQEAGVSLENKQMEAVRHICATPGGVFILNGSAGCGKTFTLNIIMKVLEKLYEKEQGTPFNPCILAPTGKAAKVASFATKLPAQTIHRALGLISTDNNSGNTFPGGCSSILTESNCFVIDEFSMVDELLCADLLTGIPGTAKVIFLGDTAQLPSIRAGKVLKDFIESGKLPTITLDVVKRQDAQSGILVNANRIVRGESIDSVIANREGEKGNAYVYKTTDPYGARQQILDMAAQQGLQKFQNGNVQILCPLKAGPTGVEEMNYYLQQVLNPKSTQKEITVGLIKLKLQNGTEQQVSKTFRVGDYVINTRNAYNKPWFTKQATGQFLETRGSGVINGETGVIEEISVYIDGDRQSHRVLYVRLEDHYAAYDNEYEDLSLAYAMTIHKSQGSQWPLVISPIVQNSIVLNRKLLYTMYTRAQDTCVLVGNPLYINQAIANDKEDSRLTLLQKRFTSVPPARAGGQLPHA